MLNERINKVLPRSIFNNMLINQVINLFRDIILM